MPQGQAIVAVDKSGSGTGAYRHTRSHTWCNTWCEMSSTSMVRFDRQCKGRIRYNPKEAEIVINIAPPLACAPPSWLLPWLPIVWLRNREARGLVNMRAKLAIFRTSLPNTTSVCNKRNLRCGCESAKMFFDARTRTTDRPMPFFFWSTVCGRTMGEHPGHGRRTSGRG